MNVLTHEGTRVPFGVLYSDSPLVLVFLRHLGCVFCAEHATDLALAAEINLAFVCLGTPEEATGFRAKKRIPQLFICDPGGDLYREFGLSEGAGRQLMSLKIMARGAKAMMKGHVNRMGPNARMLGGEFVLRTDGTVAWSHKACDVADNAPLSAIREALASVDNET